jgi:SOS-response transcriptional repressor LexA
MAGLPMGHDKRKETLLFLRGFLKENGYPPTRAEIARHFKINVNAAQGRLDTLIRQGLIAVSEHVARGIRLL